ncbi:MAG: hypothetical protein KME04_15720 [Pleurocapsa minor GSE-CHR-MK-17-07R]|jgi:hypothetical protein|nr:hypothetical protein [Pleurocapsa minor GSE-CHR-MK 17-07R]
MSALEREIMEKFHQLPPAAQARIRALIEQEAGRAAEPVAFDYADWSRNVETLRQDIRASHEAVLPAIDVVGMLRDIRDGEDE